MLTVIGCGLFNPTSLLLDSLTRHLQDFSRCLLLNAECVLLKDIPLFKFKKYIRILNVFVVKHTYQDFPS